MGGGGCFVGDFKCCVAVAIKNFFGKGSSGGCGYHPGPSDNELHAKKIADELAQMKENIRKSSSESEQEIIEYLERSMNSLLHELNYVNKQLYGGESLDINIEGIKAENEKLRNKVVGYIGRRMDDRLNLKDSELSIILDERDDKKRGKNFDKFCDKIQVQAIQGLKKKIEMTVQQQEEVIEQAINKRLKEVQMNMKESQKAYQSMIAATEKGKNDLSKEQVNCMYKYTISDILFDLMGDEE